MASAQALHQAPLPFLDEGSQRENEAPLSCLDLGVLLQELLHFPELAKAPLLSFGRSSASSSSPGSVSGTAGSWAMVLALVVRVLRLFRTSIMIERARYQASSPTVSERLQHQSIGYDSPHCVPD